MRNIGDNKNTFCIFCLFVFALCIFPGNYLFSQGNDYFLKSADHEFAMEVSRGEKGIDIALMFSKASQYEYVMIEKSADAQNGFSQCKYIKFNDSANDSVVIVKRDTYPLTGSEDVFYRVKTITKEGVSRAYPAVRLPAIRDDKKLRE